MHVAKYWASVRIRRNHALLGHAIEQTVWGRSDVSASDAALDAEQRGAALRDRPIEPREISRACGREDGTYPSYPRLARPEPLLEDIIDPARERVGAITLNGYGAEVLNTARLAFFDVDIEEAGMGLGYLVGRLFGRGNAERVDPETRAVEALRAWVNEQDGRTVRVYRTAGGLRYLVVCPEMAPADPATRTLMQRLGVDERYAIMCKFQESFRARVSPKPWRIGIERVEVHYNTYNDSNRDLVDWLERYREKSRDFSVCKLIEVIGRDTLGDETSARMIQMHDELCGVGVDLPLA